MNILAHKVESASRKNIAVITGNYECVGVDFNAYTGTDSYVSVLYDHNEGNTLILLDTITNFLAVLNVLIYYAVIPSGSQDIKTPTGALSFGNHMFIVGNVETWGGKTFDHKSTFISITDEAYTCQPFLSYTPVTGTDA